MVGEGMPDELMQACIVLCQEYCQPEKVLKILLEYSCLEKGGNILIIEISRFVGCIINVCYSSENVLTYCF